MLLIPKGKEPEDYSAWASKVGEISGLGGGDDAVDLLLGRRGDGLGDQRALSEETGLSRRDAPCSVFG